MKYFLLLLCLIGVMQADMIKKKTLACPSIAILQNSSVETQKNTLKLNMYAIANDCEVLTRKDKVEAIGYDPLNSKEIYQKIMYQKTGEYLYIRRSTIQVEQGGKKGAYRF